MSTGGAREVVVNASSRAQLKTCEIDVTVQMLLGYRENQIGCRNYLLKLPPGDVPFTSIRDMAVD
jgi:hypothetical protein